MQNVKTPNIFSEYVPRQTALDAFMTYVIMHKVFKGRERFWIVTLKGRYINLCNESINEWMNGLNGP